MTFDELYELIINDWCNRLGISVDNAGFTIIATSKVITAGLYLLVIIIDGLSNNIWVGSMQASKLIEVGQDKIGRGPFLAIQGEYTCTTIEKNGGGDIPVGSTFTKNINGTDYVYESLATVAGGDDISVRALTAGTESALVVSDVLVAQKSLDFAENEIIVSAITETPVDAETIDEYREVVVAFERLRLGHGNASDYIVWVANVNGLKTGYPYTADGEAGKAVIYCESTDEEVLVPSGGLIDDAIDSIKYDSNGISQPPVEFFEFVNTSYVLPVQITGVKLELTNGDSQQQSSIESLVREYLLLKRPFLHTVNKFIQTTEGYNTYENTVALVDIIQLLVNAGITFDSIDMEIDILLGASYSSMSKYVVGYRGGSVYPTTLSPSNDPALALYYGECPRLEDVTFV
jgi:hypothetical protein